MYSWLCQQWYNIKIKKARNSNIPNKGFIKNKVDIKVKTDKKKHWNTKFNPLSNRVRT